MIKSAIMSRLYVEFVSSLMSAFSSVRYVSTALQYIRTISGVVYADLVVVRYQQVYYR